MKMNKRLPASTGTETGAARKVQLTDRMPLPTTSLMPSFSPPRNKLKSRTTKSATPSISTASPPTAESGFPATGSTATTRKTEWKKFKRPQLDSGFRRRKTLADYANHVRAHKCGFFSLCLLSSLIVTAILAASMVVSRKNRLTSDHPGQDAKTFMHRTTVDESSTTTRSISDNISRYDDLNEICRSPPKGRRCSYHRGRVRRNCTHVICDSVMINLVYNAKLHAVMMYREQSRTFKVPAKDGEPCIHENSFGHCQKLECLPGLNIAALDNIQQRGGGDNDDDDYGGTWSAVKNENDPGVCLNISPGNKTAPWQRYAFCNNTDHDRSCTSIEFRVQLRSCRVPKKSRSGRLSCFDKTKSTSELLPMEMVVCPNICPELKVSGEKIICRKKTYCVRGGIKIGRDFSLCCFKTVAGGFSPGRCLAGLCIPVEIEREPQITKLLL